MSLIKPGLQTPFHIDFAWWERNERDWKVFLRSLLCAEHQAALASTGDNETVDWVDPETAEVKRVDGVQDALMNHCALQADFLTARTTVVEAAFRLFLANGNHPLTVSELGARLGRPADVILRTLGGARVYRGLRPVQIS